MRQSVSSGADASRRSHAVDDRRVFFDRYNISEKKHGMDGFSFLQGSLEVPTANYREVSQQHRIAFRLGDAAARDANNQSNRRIDSRTGLLSSRARHRKLYPKRNEAADRIDRPHLWPSKWPIQPLGRTVILR